MLTQGISLRFHILPLILHKKQNKNGGNMKKKTCGLDVHKDTIFCAIYDGKDFSEVKVFSTLTDSIYSMGEYIQSEGVKEIALESTGIYWIAIWNILEDMGFNVMLVNPYLIKQMPGCKSDSKDARWIAKLLHKGLLRGSLVPDKKIRELRTYSRKYVKLQQRQTSVLQNMEHILEMCSIRITSYVSNISGKSIINVIRKIVEGETDPEVLIKEIHGRIIKKHTEATIKASLKGFILEHQRFSLELSLEEYDMLVRQSKECLDKMEELCYKEYRREMGLLLTIPGINRISAMIIIAETGADMRAFENSRKFNGWTGLRPRNDESAGKYKSTATTKGNRHLRAVLVQCAWAATRIKGSYFKDKYNHLAIRKSGKKALIAIARKLSSIIWNILYYGEEYDAGKHIIYDPYKLKAKISYHQREVRRLENLLQ